MGNKAKLIVIILAALMVASGMVALQAYNAKTELENRYIREVKELSSRNDEISKQLSRSESERQRIKKDMDEMQGKFSKITQERDEWQRKYELINKEKEDLSQKIADISKNLSMPSPVSTTESPKEPSGLGEKAYWANIIKEKTALEMKLTNLSDELMNIKLEFEKILQEKKNLELAISELSQLRDNLARKLEYNEQLADNLSLELTREINDKQYLLDQYNKIKQENSALKTQIKELASAKVSLEKGLAKQHDDKAALDKRLYETESIIQNRISDIKQLKNELEDNLGMSQNERNRPPVNQPTSVQLPPIVVYPQGKAQQDSSYSSLGKTGRVISINDTNNFVIIDLGENDGVRVKDRFGVYRDSKKIATVEVINLRKDISAADMVEVTEKIRPDDIVR